MFYLGELTGSGSYIIRYDQPAADPPTHDEPHLTDTCLMSNHDWNHHRNISDSLQRPFFFPPLTANGLRSISVEVTTTGLKKYVFNAVFKDHHI